MKADISNCHIRAWKYFVDGKAKKLCFAKSKFSRLDKYCEKWYWKPIKFIGIVLQWIGSVITFIGWILRWGSWYHVTWVNESNDVLEFMPKKDKHIRFLPPIIFDGEDIIVVKHRDEN